MTRKSKSKAFFLYSMRSLCKTLLNNTNPATTSACDRAKVLVEILSKVVSKDNSEDLDDAKILSVATSVKVEQEEVQNLKSVLGTQGTLRPIFEGQLKQKRAVREHAISLRKLVAEAGLQYSDLAQIYENSQESHHVTLISRMTSLCLSKIKYITVSFKLLMMILVDKGCHFSNGYVIFFSFFIISFIFFQI